MSRTLFITASAVCLFCLAALVLESKVLQSSTGPIATESEPSPTDVAWNRISNIRTPDEANISPDDEERAMETLVKAGITGPGGRLPVRKAVIAEHYNAMQTLVDAGIVDHHDIGVADLDPRLENQLVEATTSAEARVSPVQLSPCDKDPGNLECSEYPSGMYTPEYAKAALGPDIKVPGVVRAIGQDTSNLDSQGRAHHPEDEFDYEMRWLTSPNKNHLRASSDFEGSSGSDAAASLGSEVQGSYDGSPEYMKAAFGHGIEQVNPANPSEDVVPREGKPEPLGQEYLKAAFGPGISVVSQPSDNVVPLVGKAEPAGQEYLKASMGPGISYVTGPSDTLVPFQSKPEPLGHEFEKAQNGPGVQSIDLQTAYDRSSPLPSKATADEGSEYDKATRGFGIYNLDAQLAADRGVPLPAQRRQPASAGSKQTEYNKATLGHFIQVVDPLERAATAEDAAAPAQAQLRAAQAPAAQDSVALASPGPVARTTELVGMASSAQVLDGGVGGDAAAAAEAAGRRRLALGEGLVQNAELVDELRSDLRAACERMAARKPGFAWRHRRCEYNGVAVREQSDDLSQPPVPAVQPPPPGTVDQRGWRPAAAAGGGDVADRVLDALRADLRASCEQMASRKPGYEWKKHECLYQGRPVREQGADLSKKPVMVSDAEPAGQVDQHGYRPFDAAAAQRDALLDALLADLKASCEGMAKRKAGFVWRDHKCLYQGEHAREQGEDLSKKPVMMRDAEPAGEADQNGYRPLDAAAAQRDALVDALLADLKAACVRMAARKPGFVWTRHQCAYRGRAAREQSDDLSKYPVLVRDWADGAGEVDQNGYRPAPEGDGGEHDRRIDTLIADLKSACERTAERKPGFVWKRHQCLYYGLPARYQSDDVRAPPELTGWAAGARAPPGTVDQYGWHPAAAPPPPAPTDALADAVIADLKATCLRVAARKAGYRWVDHQCQYWGAPAREQPANLKRMPVMADAPAPPGPRPLAYKYADLKADCLRRGRAYAWAEPAEDGQPGTCLRWGEPLARPAAPPPAPLRVDDGTMPLPTDLAAECGRAGGHVRYTKGADGAKRALCLTAAGCGVIDHLGARFDCSLPTTRKNVLGAVSLASPPRPRRTKFNPDGAQGAPPATAPPLQVDTAEWARQTGLPRPLGYQNADLRGRDLHTYVKAAPAGAGWTSGQSVGDTWYYNHGTGQLVWKPARPGGGLCTEESNGDPTVPGCAWERRVQASTGRPYWYNLKTRRTQWRSPFDHRLSMPPPPPKPPARPGTWSGTAGGNPYWTPQLARAELGAHVRVLNSFLRRRASCGGQTGECDPGHVTDPGTPGNPDWFNPGRWDDGVRYNRGPGGADADAAETTAAAAAARRGRDGRRGAPPPGAAGGGRGWYSRKQYDREVPAALSAAAGGGGARARQQSLAMIYGVDIPDADAARFFDTDYSGQYTPPTAAETQAFLDRLVAQQLAAAAAANASAGNDTAAAAAAPPAPAAAGGGKAAKNTTWPARPVFVDGGAGLRQWCALDGGREMVPCRIGAGGAYRGEPPDRGVWGWRVTPRRPVTTVGAGVWTLPDSDSPYVRRAAEYLASAPGAQAEKSAAAAGRA